MTSLDDVIPPATILRFPAEYVSVTHSSENWHRSNYSVFRNKNTFVVFFLHNFYTVSKNVAMLLRYKSDIHESILIIFGKKC